MPKFDTIKTNLQSMFTIHFWYQHLGKRPNFATHALGINFVDVYSNFYRF